MSGRWDSIRVIEGDMRCYIGRPSPGRSPAVIVAQHAGGVDDFICGMCDRFAEAGLVAVAPDLYHREGPRSADDPMTRMGRLRDDQIVRDMDAAVAHAKALGEVDGERLGVTGFCMGGRVAYLMAASSTAFSAAIVFWGGNIMNAWGDGPAPFELTDRISCPVLGIFGEDDPNPNPADVAKIDADMTRFGKAHEFHSYPGAGHAFMNERRPSYRPEAAADAWRRSVEWFVRYLKR